MDIETATMRVLAHRIPIVGTLFAAEEAAVSTKAAGILRKTFVDVGAKVRPGEPLAQVDRADYQVAVNQAEASLAEALARLGIQSVPTESLDLSNVSTVLRAAAQLENARLTFERLSALGISVTAQELNDATARLRVAEADHQLAIDEAGALVATARGRSAALQLAQQKLDETQTITPPIPTTLGRDGADVWIVAARLVTEGQYVDVATEMYRLIIHDPLKLRSKVPERYAGEVKIGQPIALESVSGAAAPMGRIVRISPAVDPASRTFEVEALIDNENEALKSGTFAKGIIAAEGVTRAITIPTTAVVTTGGATQIFVIEGGTARRRLVELGRTADERIEVFSGLTEGETFVAVAIPALSDGASVRVKQP